MAKKPAPTQKDFNHLWHIREWLASHRKAQVDLIKDLNWSKAKASAVWHGQQYTQSLIDELAPYLQARPYELLMSPDEAMALRGLRANAVRIVGSMPSSEVENAEPDPAAQPRQKRA